MSSRNDDPVSEKLSDLERRRKSHRKWFYAKRPKPISNVIAQVVQRRGYAQVRVAGERDEAWQAALGEELAALTQIGGVRRGVMEVVVANSLLMQELTFRKEELLTSLQQALPEAAIKQLRFRVGQIS
jgi:predicted nucleic acid-binding Zn ribbon protein